MSMYPFNPHKVCELQQSEAGVLIDRCHLAHYHVPAASGAIADHYVAGAPMANGAYVLANTAPGDGTARKVVATRTVVGDPDTPGTLTIVGTDLAGSVITETINVGAHGVAVPTNQAFAAVTSITGAGWTVDAGGPEPDTIDIGFTDAVGLQDRLPHNTVMMVTVNDVREATAPAVTVSTTVLALNTVDPDTALAGAPLDIYYVV